MLVVVVFYKISFLFLTMKDYKKRSLHRETDSLSLNKMVYFRIDTRKRNAQTHTVTFERSQTVEYFFTEASGSSFGDLM